MSIIIGLIPGEKPIEIPNEVNCCFSILTVGKSKCSLHRKESKGFDLIDFTRIDGPEHEVVEYLSHSPATKVHASPRKLA